MDSSLLVASDDGELSWSDSNSVVSSASEDHFDPHRPAHGPVQLTLSTSLPAPGPTFPSSPPHSLAMAAAWSTHHHHHHLHSDAHFHPHHSHHHHNHYHGHSHGHPDNHHQSSASASRLRADQLSPISTGMMEITLDGASSAAPAMIHSASVSSCTTTDSWSTRGFGDHDDGDRDVDAEIHWENGPEDTLTAPKLEPMDDDFLLEDLRAAPLAPEALRSHAAVGDDEKASGAAAGVLGSGPVKQRRPRGRPRKNHSGGSSKIAKGRSKTGCITCRRRKKKCDEAKPRCMNCEKNAVFCEGYHEKQIWKSGKEKAEEERLRRESLLSITVQPIFHGVETLEDKIFWKHYCHQFSNVLTVEGEARNAFKDIILQLATKQQGLMHSILSVASRHIDYDTPYGIKLLHDNPSTSYEALESRSHHHYHRAMQHLYRSMERPVDRDDPDHPTILAARYGQMICLVLQTRAEGTPSGEHRFHLQAYQKLIRESPPRDPAFLSFICEFFQYHIYADELLWHPDMSVRRLAIDDTMSDGFPVLPPAAVSSAPATPRPSSPTAHHSHHHHHHHPHHHHNPRSAVPHPPRLLGVFDGLFRYLSQITSMRNTIRSNIENGVDPVVDYTCLWRAAEIDAALYDWKPHWPPGDSREKVGLLYKQMLWVYLFRTTYPPAPASGARSASSSASVSAGPSSRRHSFVSYTTSSGSQRSPSAAAALHTPSTQPSSPTTQPSSAKVSAAGATTTTSTAATNTTSTSIVNAPQTPISPTMSVPTRPSTSSSAQPFSGRPSTAAHDVGGGGGGGGGGSRTSSPPPIRRPPQHDHRITVAVEESLAILETFKHSDPAQTLLLIPCLVVGTAAFDPAQRRRISNAIRTVKGYTGLRNCDRVAELLAEVWTLMEEGDWMAVWDWQGVARRMGLDFLCA